MQANQRLFCLFFLSLVLKWCNMCDINSNNTTSNSCFYSVYTDQGASSCCSFPLNLKRFYRF